jgi:5-formyltetrahydrofolate cyclo-ligase
MALGPDARADQTHAIARDLDSLEAAADASLVSVYWPIRGEPDLRAWMHALSDRRLRVALPVALALGQPVVFRDWRPNAHLARGLWNIPYPADGPEVVPNIVAAPLVGFAGECYRLGYGGGFFDRTVGLRYPKAVAIGIGYSSAALRTIFPQPHDIPMDWIVTGSTAPVRRAQQSANTRVR